MSDRPDPLYTGSRQDARRPSESRNGAIPRPNGTPSTEAEENRARAARFDDEKRRIIESCFSKKDDDGSQLESYITHIRIVEDGAYPSSPAPPDSGAANKKSRIILVAVRKSGRVRVHKARENPTGSFSVGKTWNLDDLNAIQVYSAMVPTNSQEQQYKQWASNTGFVVTLGKPYYWQASTSKEKDFFIGSLIKIYRKYTGGNLPELQGFTTAELDQYIGQPTPKFGSNSQTNTPSPQSASKFAPRSQLPSAALQSNPSLAQPPNMYGDRTPSQDSARGPNGHRPQTRDGPQTPMRDELRTAGTASGQELDGSPRPPPGRNGENVAPRSDRFPGQDQRTERAPSIPGPAFNADLRPPLTAHSSHSSLQPDNLSQEQRYPRQNGIKSASRENVSAGQLGLTSSVADVQRQRNDSGTFASSRPSTATSDRRTPDLKHEPPPVPEAMVPARLRPLVPKAPPFADQRSVHSEDNSSKFSTPLATPSAIRSEPKASVQTVERQQAGEQRTNVPPGDYFAQPTLQKDGPSDNQASPAVSRDEPPAPGDSTGAAAMVPPVLTEEPEGLPADETKEEHRPGLGPMVKKKSAKDIANTFRKAALAASAFQPRAGGAAARLKQQQERNANEPDGITGVVPAPLLRGMSTDSARSGTPDNLTPATEKDRPFSPGLSKATPQIHLQRKATDDVTPPEVTSRVPEQQQQQQQQTAQTQQPVQPPERQRSRSPARRRRQRQEAEIEKYCSSLGIDPKIIDARGAEFNDLLTEFGWDGRLTYGKKVDDVEVEIRREIGRAQATGWLGHIDQQESKVQELAKAFEKAIDECEELDGLLTLYSHELDTLHDDIQYIEAQSQGLQVQTANQKLLQKELHSLLKTLTISTSDLRGLQSAPLETVEGVQEVEHSLSTLYRAMTTIDPDIRQNRIRQAEATTSNRSGLAVYADTHLGEMRAVREKKEHYREETQTFLRRFSHFMTSAFKRAEQRTSEENARATAASSVLSLDLQGHQASRQELWVYNALLLFVREVNTYEWQTLITSYEMNIKSTYQDQFRDNIGARKRLVRRDTAEDYDVLFTSQEKERNDDALTSAARKLTVKRGKTVKSNPLRRSLADRQDGKCDAWETFESVLQQQAKVVSEEQNFLVSFFHLHSQMTVDFAEIVSTRPPAQRRLPNLTAKQSYDPDRNLAKIVQQAMESIYSFWANDMQALVEWTLRESQLQGIGLLGVLEQCLSTYEETNQEYIARTLRTLHDRLTALFHKFIDEQVKAIEETKVKVKKRKGIISFMRTFPLFAAAVENMMPTDGPHHESLEVRFIVNDAYTKILKAMWESLNFIAKDDPTHGAGTHSTAPTSGDPEDKEALNYHILLIENMKHYLDEVDTRSNVVLNDWADRATHDLHTHLTAYTDAVIRRPLGKFLDFLESTESHMKNSPDASSYASIAGKPSHSRSTAKKIIASHDTREIRKGIETLKKRVEKHFGDVDDLSTSHTNQQGGLVGRVLDECASRYVSAFERMRAIIDGVYEGNLEFEMRREEVAAWFRRV